MKSSRHEEAESERHKSIVVGILLRPSKRFLSPGKRPQGGLPAYSPSSRLLARSWSSARRNDSRNHSGGLISGRASLLSSFLGTFPQNLWISLFIRFQGGLYSSQFHEKRRAREPAPLGEGNIMADERARAIDLALSQIEKQFGKGSIMRLGSKEAIVPISIIPTGSISFDAALGVGGFP